MTNPQPEREISLQEQIRACELLAGSGVRSAPQLRAAAASLRELQRQQTAASVGAMTKEKQ